MATVIMMSNMQFQITSADDCRVEGCPFFNFIKVIPIIRIIKSISINKKKVE